MINYTDKVIPMNDNNQVLKTLLGIALANLVHTAMDNHFFTVGNKFYKQKDGGAIGSDLTGEVARIVMLLWDEAFLTKLHRLGITEQLYKRYVDDIIMALNKMSNMKYDPTTDSIVPAIDSDEDNTTESDIQTFRVIKQVADSIEECIQMEYDVPSMNTDKKLAVLDLKLITTARGEIHYTFYKKPVSHPMTINARSAVSMLTKRNTIYQECTRRMKNTSQDLGWKETADHLSKYMDSLRISGYNHQFRYNVLKGVISKEIELRNKLKLENKHRHRTKDEILAAKRSKPGRNNNTWQLRGNNRVTLKVSATPNSQLAKMMREGLKKYEWKDLGKTMVTETSGERVTAKLFKSNPFKTPGCVHHEKCPVQSTQDCMNMNCTYNLTCKVCQDQGDEVVIRNRGKYIGCTGRSAHRRGSEHLEAAKKMDVKLAIGKHYRQHHSEVAKTTEEPIVMDILAVHRGVMERFIDEGIRLEQSPHLANSKSEWGRGGGLVRLTAHSTQVDTVCTTTNNRTEVFDDQIHRRMTNDTNTPVELPVEADERGGEDQLRYDTLESILNDTYSSRQSTNRSTQDIANISGEEVELTNTANEQASVLRRNPRRTRNKVIKQYEDIVD